MVALTACASVERIPYTQQEQELAVVPGFPDVRVWADDPALARRNPVIDLRQTRERPAILALSGGGADGAFGAGLLNGWTQRGDRPQFAVVTGASAGSLIAPFAFLGSRYDNVLADVFSSGAFDGFLQFEGFSGLFGPGLFAAGPLRELIAKHVTPQVLDEIAVQYRAGRKLYVVTTQLDAQRTAIWDMGRIASSGQPGALELFRRVIEASASIPGIFSPVLIDVGVETYSAKTFSSRRYEIWTMQSAYHNLPTINGVQQAAGRQYEARNTSFKSDDAGAEFGLNIEAAYPAEAGLERWRRTVRLDRRGGTVQTTDAYALKGGAGRVELTLMCARPVRVDGSALVIEGGAHVEVTGPSAPEFKVEECPTTDARLRPIWGDRVYRVLAQWPSAPKTGELRMVVRRS